MACLVNRSTITRIESEPSEVGRVSMKSNRDRVPGSPRNRELFQQAIRLVSLGFGSHTSSTRLAIFLDKFVESRPSVFSSDEFDCLILARMTSKYVIVFVA